MSYERENIRRMSGYVPGEQPRADDVVKLNTNENPYSPTPAVLAALKETRSDQLRRYPPPTAPQFRAAAAKVHGLKPA
ncbi:MAG: histidinol-phosphatase, partial [Phycisphaerae bacterium]|nr:histidinol-phosphatase [Phycisphaerae bacterium]